MKQILKRAKKIQGTLKVPGDKSISHRGLILGALAKGVTEVHSILQSEDLQSTAHCLSLLGVKISQKNQVTLVEGVGSFPATSQTLDCGNSGTTMRVLLGALCGYPGLKLNLSGDASLNKRPMLRVAEPLRQMGARIELTQNQFAPCELVGTQLQAINYSLPVASAQVKTALILAALRASGTTTLTGKIQSRDHTERLLPFFGGKLTVTGQQIVISGEQTLQANKLIVPGDPSTAAFWMGAAALIPSSKMKIINVSLNPTRLGFLRALIHMGAKIDVDTKVTTPEPMGDVYVTCDGLNGITLNSSDIPELIDELPLLAVLATQAQGTTEVRGAEELRVKESDRLEAVAKNLRNMGAEIEVFADGFKIQGPQKLRGATIQTFLDHRIAMAFSIAALVADGETIIEDAECVAVSYPDFFSTLNQLVQS